MKIWFRYLLLSICKNYISFLCILFCIYSIVDLSIHGVRFFSRGAVGWVEIAKYYAYDFLNHVEFFFPFTFLIASLKVLLDLNSHNELVALQIAGLSKKKLLSPFFIFAAFLALASYANQEWISPFSQEAAELFRSHHSKRKKKTKKTFVYSTALQDKTELVYQGFNESTKELYDVFWVKSNKDIWHMKYLKIATPSTEIPKGRFVDHFQKNKKNLLEKTESFISKDFPQISLENNAPLQTFIPFENRPLSTLLQQSVKPYSEKPIVISHLHYKLATPILSILILIAIAPISMQFKRHKAILPIFAIGLFSFVGFMTILQGMLILGENQVVPGYIAIWGPVCFAILICMPRFAKTQ